MSMGLEWLWLSPDKLEIMLVEASRSAGGTLIKTMTERVWPPFVTQMNNLRALLDPGCSWMPKKCGGQEHFLICACEGEGHLLIPEWSFPHLPSLTLTPPSCNTLCMELHHRDQSNTKASSEYRCPLGAHYTGAMELIYLRYLYGAYYHSIGVCDLHGLPIHFREF